MTHLEAAGQRKLRQAQSSGSATSIRDRLTPAPLLQGYVILLFTQDSDAFLTGGLPAMEFLMMARKELKTLGADSIT